MAPRPRPVMDRLLESIEVSADGCWIWNGTVSTRGYGRFFVDGLDHRAHRFTYALLVGPIPDGLTLDHTCHTNHPTCKGGPTCIHRRCCNPEHLEAVPSGENARRGQLRKTHCKYGHEFTLENTEQSAKQRNCRECRRQRSARWKAENREAMNARRQARRAAARAERAAA